MTTEVRPRAMFSLYPKQAFTLDLIFAERVEQLLYGGAAGGGKSRLVRAVAAYIANLWSGSTLAIFRRTDAELQANHVEKWLEEVDPFVRGGRFFVQKMDYVWPAPAWCWCPKNEPCPHSSVTAFRHVDADRGVKKYQGPEFAAQCVDEATHFRGDDIEFLFTRVRATAEQRNPHEVIGPDGKPYEYPGWPGWLKLQLLTANPGDVGHQYMLDTFIDPVSGQEARTARETVNEQRIVDGPQQLTDRDGNSRWMERITLSDGSVREVTVDVSQGQRWTVEMPVEILGRREIVRVKRAFLPAKIEDNPSLDPMEYAANLAVGSQEQKQRLLDGDWTYAQDRVLKMLRRETHLVDARWIFGQQRDGRPNRCPSEWMRAIGHDHGEAKPTAAVWVCLDDEGSLIAYMEYYSPGPVGQHVREIKRRMDFDGHPRLTLWSDPRIVMKTKGLNRRISVADIYRHLGEPPEDQTERRVALERGIRIRQAIIEDDAALSALSELLEFDQTRYYPSWHPLAGEAGAPRLFIAKQCPGLWRELVNLRHGGMDEDGHYKEGIKNGQPDHAFDAVKRVVEPLRRAMVTPRRIQPSAVLEAV